jgi:glutamate 5-kinase
MTLVVKLGSSIVASEAGDLRTDVLDSVCEQVAALHEGAEEVILVTSGAIPLGMRLMGMPVRPRAMDELQASSAIGQGVLYDAYAERLSRRRIHTAQVLLTFFDMSARTHYLNARQTLRRLIDWHVVPVVNENDTTATDEITFGDNDFLAAQVAILVGARLLVLLTDTEGLHTADPRSDADAELIEEVTDFEALDAYDIGLSVTLFGTGGMRSKVVAAEMATAAGIPAVVCDGTTSGTLGAAAAGEHVGTRFPARSERISSFKLWLKYAKASHGRVVIDEGAERALREKGSSLLPVGIREVEGEFQAGDAIELACDGRMVGKGIANYSASELRQVKGMKSGEVRELLPRAGEEAVHRDYLVLD